MNWRILPTVTLLAGAALPITAAPVQAQEAKGQKRPNIVFILADDLGYTDVACYGSKYYETPNIDRLAAQGMRFTSGYTCGPNCVPTRAALMSGQYGPRTGLYTVGNIERFNWRTRSLRPVDNTTKLPLSKVTIAQTLKATGYATGMFGKWHLGDNDGYHPARRGFDEVIVASGRHFDFPTDPKTEYPPGTYLADFLTGKAEDFIRRHQSHPFFLYLPHFGVHAPHQAKTELIDKFKLKPAAGGHHDPTYAAMISSVDQSVGKLVALLDELKLSQNTLVIFSSDNGGVGGYRREGLGKDGITDNAPLRGGKGMLYDGGVRVPYIFRWPGKIKLGTACDVPINSVDFYPTLLQIATTKAPPNTVLDGTSYLSLLTGRSKTLNRDAIYWHFPGYLGAGKNKWRATPVGTIRAGDWKLLQFFETGRCELYNLRDDIGEKNDLSTKRPDKVKEMQAKLLAWQTQIKAPMPRPITAADKASGGKRRRQQVAEEED